MMKMRTISEAYNEIKAADIDTALTKFAIKTLVKSGAVPSVKIGRKQLVNMAVLSQFLEGDNPTQSSTVLSYGSIRRIEG